MDREKIDAAIDVFMDAIDVLLGDYRDSDGQVERLNAGVRYDENDSRKNYYVPVTDKALKAAGQVFADVSEVVKAAIDDLGGFVSPVYRDCDDEYIKRIARMVAGKSVGDPAFELVVRAAKNLFQQNQ